MESDGMLTVDVDSLVAVSVSTHCHSSFQQFSLARNAFSHGQLGVKRTRLPSADVCPNSAKRQPGVVKQLTGIPISSYMTRDFAPSQRRPIISVMNLTE